MSNRTARAIEGNYRKAVSEPHEFIIFHQSSEDLFTWYLLFRNLVDFGAKESFNGGYYLVKLEIPTDFPDGSASKFHPMTPNGVYDVSGGPPCIEVGHFHPENKRAAEGLVGFAHRIVTGMMNYAELHHGISVKIEKNKMKGYAEASNKFNWTKYPLIMAEMRSAFEIYSKKWPTPTDANRHLYTFPDPPVA